MFERRRISIFAFGALMPGLAGALPSDYPPLWSRVEADGVVHWIVGPHVHPALPRPNEGMALARAAQVASLLARGAEGEPPLIGAASGWQGGAVGWSVQRGEPGPVLCLAPAVATDSRCVFAQRDDRWSDWAVSGSYAGDGFDFGLSFRQRWLSGVEPNLGTSLAPQARWSAETPGTVHWQQRNIGFLGALETGWGRFALGLDLAQVEHGGQRIDQGAISLSWLQGTFGGVVTGQVSGSTEAPEQGWGGLDLGLLWRTPWRGTVAVGAKNLISTGPAPKLPMPRDKAAALDRFERMPYVRYEQDL